MAIERTPSGTAAKASNDASTGARTFNGFSEITSFLWSVADLLRGDYKQADYGKVILPLTVIRRLDCVLDKTKAKVLTKHAELKQAKHPEGTIEKMLVRITGVPFYNTSKLDFEKLKGDPNHIGANLTSYIKGFSPNARDVIEQFKFADQIAKLDESNLLFQVVSQFAAVDLHPDAVPNHVMGSIFEELIRRFAEASNETAGEHFTPREVIRLMVDLLFIEDEETLTKKGIVRTLYDPACGTGGMLSVAEEYLRELNPHAKLEVFGQELNSESFAICESDMMIKGQNPENIIRGNSFSEDGHVERKFDYMLSNPPFGVEWKKVQKEIEKEHETKGFAGRFGPGLPRINDGSLLFLLHMLSKMKPVEKSTTDGGSRIAIVLNGSPLSAGDAGSGESEIRRWLIENDWVEAIVGLPMEMFYNTGISTYIWILSNRKTKERRGKIQLINASGLYRKLRRPLGEKRNELSADHIRDITRSFGDFKDSAISKIFRNEEFGYRRIVLERPLRMKFVVSPQSVDRLQAEAAFKNLVKPKKAKKGARGHGEPEGINASGVSLQKRVLEVVRSLGHVVYSERRALEEELRRAFVQRSLDVPKGVVAAIVSSLGERDINGTPCLNGRGEPEPDPTLRDSDTVPLKEEIRSYFEREIRPNVPDAWWDDSKTRIGYEIPFSLHFYSHKPMRPVQEILQDIRALEGQIRELVTELER
jgi:type I restriction enzyme M protein